MNKYSDIDLSWQLFVLSLFNTLMATCIGNIKNSYTKNIIFNSINTKTVLAVKLST